MSDIVTTDKPTHEDIIRVLENSLYPGAKRESIELVLAYCRANGLDPMLRPVYIVPTSIKKPDGQWETRDVLMPGIADYRIKAARSGEYGGKSEPEFGPDVRETLGGVAVAYPAWCRVTVKRIVQGHPREFVAMERWLENYATAKRDTQAPNTMWKKRPYGQLAKVAEAQALRMAFPEFSAGYTAEEMQGKTLHDDWAGPTLEAEAPSPAPMRAAAAPTPRPERKVAREDFNPGDTPHDRWMALLRTAMDKATSREEAEAIGERPSVKDYLAKATEAQRMDISAVLANGYGRHVGPQNLETPDDLHIEGEQYVAAG